MRFVQVGEQATVDDALAQAGFTISNPSTVTIDIELAPRGTINNVPLTYKLVPNCKIVVRGRN